MSSLIGGLQSLPELSALVGALAVLVLLAGLYWLAVPRQLERRLSHFVASQRRQATPEVAGGQTGDLMASLNRRVARRKWSVRTQTALARAGLHISVAEFVSLRLVAGLSFLALTALLLYRSLGPLALAVGLVAALAASFVPNLVVGFRAGRRVRAIETQLPDALDMMAAGLQSGAGLGQSIELISREMTEPIGEEFGRVMQEIGLGLSVTEALVNLSDRVGSEDLDLVVTTLGIQARVGGNLVQVLRTINGTIRERVRIKGEIRVLTSQQRLSGWVVGMLPPSLAVAMMFMNPTYMGHLFDPGITRVMLGAAIVMTVAGVFALLKITNIEV